MKDIPPAFIRFLLFPFTGLYGLAIEIWNLLYDKRCIKTSKFDIPVISVGNLTVGGTGKTPFVIYLAQHLKESSLSVGIVSRGYGRKTKGTVVVHDGKSILSSHDESGDEPWLIASALKSVPVIVDEDRTQGIQTLIDKFPVDVVLLDDAFQHRRAGRDLDILLINSREPSENYHLLPGGRLREPLRQSRRASLIIHTKCPGHNIPAFADRLAEFTACPQISSVSVHQLVQYRDGDFSLSEIPKDERVFAFCGVGDPASFRQTLTDVGISPVKFVAFPDHQAYSESVIKNLRSQMEAGRCKAIVTTEKDLVKLPPQFLESFSIYIIKMTINLDETGKKILTNLINQIMIKKESDL